MMHFPDNPAVILDSSSTSIKDWRHNKNPGKSGVPIQKWTVYLSANSIQLPGSVPFVPDRAHRLALVFVKSCPSYYDDQLLDNQECRVRDFLQLLAP